ncbi:MAG: IS1 family transposase [Pirellulaceae bacterium]
MNKLSREQRCAVIRCLVEGCSIRSTGRITGASKNTIQKLTRELGEACLAHQDKALRLLPCKRIECDEIWNFCYAKDKNLPDEMRHMQGVGSMWTWTAICAETKLVLSWRLGNRDAANAWAFIGDVSDRLRHRVQLTTDGNRLYVEPIEEYMGGMVDYAMLIKKYGTSDDETKYSPGKCLGTEKRQIDGCPDESLVSTSYAERQNLNIRMQNRRFTRLTNAFSKKAEMLAYSIAIMFCYHNFVRVHQTLKTTPAVKAGIAARRWTIEDMVNLIPEKSRRKAAPTKSGIQTDPLPPFRRICIHEAILRTMKSIVATLPGHFRHVLPARQLSDCFAPSWGRQFQPQRRADGEA